MNCTNRKYKRLQLSRNKGLHCLFSMLAIAFTGIFPGKAQQVYDQAYHARVYRQLRSYDSVIASRIPVMELPERYRARSLPVSVDNSKYNFFPAIQEQHMYFTCQQFSGIYYTYGYEVNRLMNSQANLPRNRFPPHYTWTFMNKGDQFAGVSFFYSFQVLKEQGHMTLDDYGDDTLQKSVGWISGYDKYYRGMKNRIKAVYSIPVNSEEGILTLKHYLNDHLDGSATGGLACFSASSYFAGNFRKIPAGTPEAGKDVLVAFYPIATHGMTIVGYNDSIRYDLNGDGKFTNDMDITNDGITDARDWEIGAFRVANSFGTWWSDNGFCYILYRAMALNYDYANGGWSPDRGIWNHSVYIVEPDTGYKPLLTMKVKLTHNSREKIRIKAGISSDTSRLFPEHVIDFPFISFQGGDHVMRGFDALPDNQTIEVGYDLTPLLSYADPGQAERFFLMVEEKDTLETADGIINQCSFIDYTNGVHEIAVPRNDVPVNNNSLTLVSATGTVGFDKVRIVTENLPAYNSSQPYQVQLSASGGKPPYKWTLMRSYEKLRKDTLFPSADQQKLQQDATYIPYTRIALPFSFPFYGQKYDSIYVNFYGFITFDREQLPYPYTTDEEGMMKRTRIISPYFNMNVYYRDTSFGVWVESHPGWITIRWETGDPVNNALRNNFALRLYPSGEFEFLYGDLIDVGQDYITYSGYSCGDENNFDIWTNWNSTLLANKSYMFRVQPIPSEITVTNDGMLGIASADTVSIYEIPVKVTDANKISAIRSFTLSTGLSFTQEIACGGANLLKYGFPAHFRLVVRNDGSYALQDLQLKLVAGDSSLILSDSIMTVPFLGPGSSMVIEDAFTFQLSHPLQEMYPIDFMIIASTSDHQWRKTFNIPVSAPDIIINDPDVYDGYDGFLDPGEIADLNVPVLNLGSLYADNLEFRITTTDQYLTILSQPVQVIDYLPAFSSAGLTFRLQASQSTPQSHNAELLLTITDHKTINLVKQFNLQLGKVNVAIFSLSLNQASASGMRSSLDSLQVAYEYHTSLPYKINQFSSLFISLGTTAVNHILTQPESTQLANYLSKGGRLYMEGYSTWYYNNKTILHPYFRYTSKKIPAWYYYTVEGVKWSFTESMDFGYQSPTYYALFSFVPVPPAFGIFTNSDTSGKYLQIAYGGDDYKTIGSLIEFGSLMDDDPPSEKITLMRRYLDFFDVAAPGPRPLFHCSSNSVCRWDSVGFTDDSFDNVVTWQWEFPGGSPSVSSAPAPSVYYVDAGSYDVKLTVSDGVHSRSITKEDFIKVQVCAGSKELSNNLRLNVYPNPATSLIRIKVPGPVQKGSKLCIFDLMGRKVLERSLNSGIMEMEILLDVTSLHKGLYIIRQIPGFINQSAKMIIE
jgi:PKD repeat protein